MCSDGVRAARAISGEVLSKGDAAAREALRRAAQRLGPSGLTPGRSGNVSVRVAEGLLVTPSGLPYASLTVDDMVLLTPEGAAHPGQRKPTSEWRIHVDIYAARPEAAAVVHVHSPAATALSMHRRALPAVHYMLAVAGGADVRCADYATFGTEALSRHVLAALEGRRACLMANHGMVAFGRDLDHALEVASEVEYVAELYLRARALGAEPVALDDAEMQRVVALLDDYGR